MGEEQKDRKKAWKKIFKPDKWKIVFFILFLMLLSILPLYPTHTDEYSTLLRYSDSLRFEGSHTTFQPLCFVLIKGYSWTEIDIVPAGMKPGDSAIAYTHSHEANPFFLVLYVPYTILTYLIACYLTELYRWKKKHVYEKGVKEL